MEFSQIYNTDWVKVVKSIDLDDLWRRSLQTFIQEVQHANSRFAFNINAHNSVEFKAVITVLFAVFTIDLFCSYVLSRKDKSTFLLIAAEALALSKVLLIWFVPTTPMRFGFALIIFASGLGVHSRVCDQLQTDEERPDGTLNRFFLEVFNTQYFNILSRMHKFGEFKIPPLLRTLHGLVLLVLIDTCTYLIREWIPDTQNVSLANQTSAQAIVGGVWAVVCMEFLYGVAASQSDLMGLPLPIELRHRHPLLSTSLNEFWGIRWNPIIGKLLQDSFYKPLKRMKMSRAICVLACFTGSAMLHALPQYISTRDVSDCYMMFGFFFLNGVCLMAEILVQRAFGFSKKSPKRTKSTASFPSKSTPATASNKQASSTFASSNAVDDSVSESDSGSTTDETVASRRMVKSAVSHPLSVYRTAPCQFLAELLTIGCILCTSYAGLEGWYGQEARLTAEQRSLWVRAAVSCAAGATVLFYFVRRYIHRGLALRHVANSHAKKHSEIASNMSLSQFFFSVVGWAWSVTSLMVMLPLFTLPVLHAVEPLYAKSFVIGSIVRTFNAVILPEVTKHI